jgi:hypothetical protein
MFRTKKKSLLWFDVHVFYEGWGVFQPGLWIILNKGSVWSVISCSDSAPILLFSTVEPVFYVPTIYVFASFVIFFLGLFSFPIFIMHCLPRLCVSEVSNFLRFTYLEHIEREKLWHKMASAARTSTIYIFRVLKEGTVLTKWCHWETACV